MVTKQDIEEAAAQAQKENALFADKACLDGLAPLAGAPVGRAEKAGELVRALAGGLGKGYAPPFVFVYGRTGSGKSTVVQFVCSQLPVSYRVVNLRRARAVYGCACLVLQELGREPLGGETMELLLKETSECLSALAAERPFVLVLDEFDALFSDRRRKASDFVYRLLDVLQRLRENGRVVSVVAVSNNVAASDEFDDRVRSRIGSAPEVFFDAYSKDEIVAILKDRAEKALAGPVGKEVIEYCAQICSDEHGDARRAIDLLKSAAETAGLEGEEAVLKKHVDLAAARLQKEKVEVAMARVSYHTKVACSGLVRIAYLAPEQVWYSTSTLYRQYCTNLQKEVKPVGYRRFSELLGELENLGLAASRTQSKGRHGYGREYKLAVPPEVAGPACFAEW